MNTTIPLTASSFNSTIDNAISSTNNVQTTNSSITSTASLVENKEKGKSKPRKKTKNDLKKSNQKMNSIAFNTSLLSPLNQQINGSFNQANSSTTPTNLLSNNDFLNLMKDQFNNQLSSQLSSQFANQLTNHLSDQLGSQFADQLSNESANQLTSLNNHFNQLNGISPLNSTLINQHLMNSKLQPFINQNSSSNNNILDLSKEKKHDESSKKSSAINQFNYHLNGNEVNSSSKSDKEKEICKSLLCDQNGLVFAETIYRCPVCKTVNEFVNDAKQHFHTKHVVSQDRPSNSILPSLNNLSQMANLNGLNGLNGLTDFSLNSLNGLSNNGLSNLANGLTNGLSNGFNSGSFNNAQHHQLNQQSSLNSCLSRISNNSFDNLYNDDSTNSNLNIGGDQMDEQAIAGLIIEKLNKLNKQHNQKNSSAANTLSLLANQQNGSSNPFQPNLNLNSITHQQNQHNLALCINNFYPNDQPMNDGLGDEGFFSNNSSLANNENSDGDAPSSKESCTKSGYITCPVCSQCRYYTTLQRRYGRFTCVACYRFIKEFFTNPEIYSCPSLGECILSNKQKCKACWINSCISVYSSDDPRRKEIFEKYQPIQSLEPPQQPNDRLTNGQSDVFDLSDQFLNNTNDNTPTSLLNDEDMDDCQSFEDEESSAPDFPATKQLLLASQKNEKDEFKTLASDSNNLKDFSSSANLNVSDDSITDKCNGHSNNTENKSINTSPSKDEQSIIKKDFSNQQQLLKESNNNCSTNQSFTTSLHNFMQSNQLLNHNTNNSTNKFNNNQFQTDWNNNSLPDSQLTNGQTNNNSLSSKNGQMNGLSISTNLFNARTNGLTDSLTNGLSDLMNSKLKNDNHVSYSGINGTNNLLGFNLDLIQENDSRAKKRTKLQTEEVC